MSTSQQPYDPNAQGNAWEQSQPTGQVWDQQSMEAWGTQPPRAPEPPSAPAPAPVSPKSSSGFVSSLLDLNFSSFLTLKAIKATYLVLTAAFGLLILIDVITAFTRDAGHGLVQLLIGAVTFVAGVIAIRVVLEVAFAVVRGSEDIRSQLHPR